MPSFSRAAAMQAYVKTRADALARVGSRSPAAEAVNQLLLWGRPAAWLPTPIMASLLQLVSGDPTGDDAELVQGAYQMLLDISKVDCYMTHCSRSDMDAAVAVHKRMLIVARLTSQFSVDPACQQLSSYGQAGTAWYCRLSQITRCVACAVLSCVAVCTAADCGSAARAAPADGQPRHRTAAAGCADAGTLRCADAQVWLSAVNLKPCSHSQADQAADTALPKTHGQGPASCSLWIRPAGG